MGPDVSFCESDSQRAGSLSSLPKSHCACFASSCTKSRLRMKLLCEALCSAKKEDSGTDPAANNKEHLALSNRSQKAHARS